MVPTLELQSNSRSSFFSLVEVTFLTNSIKPNPLGVKTWSFSDDVIEWKDRLPEMKHISFLSSGGLKADLFRTERLSTCRAVLKCITKVGLVAKLTHRMYNAKKLL